MLDSGLELKNRKKLSGTSMASPFFSAMRSAATDVMPLLPFAVGQSARSSTNTGLTYHQIALWVA